MAAACDYFIAGDGVVLNPSYGAMALSGSEYHTISYSRRCGGGVAVKLKMEIMPLSAIDARAIGLADAVFPGSGKTLTRHMMEYITLVLMDGFRLGPWKRGAAISLEQLQTQNRLERDSICADFSSE